LRACCLAGHDLSRPLVALLELGLSERMHQVVRNLDTVECATHGIGILCIGGHPHDPGSS
jgi:hypothetical protein